MNWLVKMLRLTKMPSEEITPCDTFGVIQFISCLTKTAAVKRSSRDGDMTKVEESYGSIIRLNHSVEVIPGPLAFGSLPKFWREGEKEPLDQSKPDQAFQENEIAALKIIWIFP